MGTREQEETSLVEAMKLHREVRLISWTTNVTQRNRQTKTIVHYFLHEEGETIGVYSRSRVGLRDLLVSWFPDLMDISLVEFAGRRNFRIYAPKEDQKKAATDVRSLVLDLSSDEARGKTVRMRRGSKLDQIAAESTVAA